MKKTICCLAEMAFQFDMETDLGGGGERYLEDFISLLKDLGYNVRLYQFSQSKVTKSFRGHRIKGLGNVKLNMQYGDVMKNGIQEFKKQSQDADGIFLLSMNLSNYKFDKPTLTVSHGIIGDNNTDNLQYGRSVANAMKKWIGNADRTISVDTNSIHIMQLINPAESQKMLYIPNYVDLDKYKYHPKNNDKFRVLFARRISPERGYIEMAKACEILSMKYDDIEFTFCGTGHKDEEDKLHSIIDKLQNVKHISLAPNDMPKAYEDNHVSVVPTTTSEGTSLSALESLATGTVPIVTTIGGLTDIVTPNFNGLMIAPRCVEEIVQAIEYLYHNRGGLHRMRDNGLNMISAFSKDRWNCQISSVVRGMW